ncbi:MAG: hypothetical protein KAT46_05955 [Deltaproteobacteria bacterium]|nr:hypothetical protein [Deltaproteobacteria bacterium]
MFGTAVLCMDGRAHETTVNFVKDNFNVKYVDIITEAGADVIVAKFSDNEPVIKGLKTKLEISIHKHHSKVITIAGHADCAGNPIDEENHRKDILAAVDRIKSWYPEILVIGVWVGNDWKAVKVEAS